ncbi:reverse transcriptase domain-containing protein [Tanacetum coccineum]
MFAATTPENTPMAYRASTSANPNPMNILAFVEANYEALESLLRDRSSQMRNNDLRTELEYFSKDYDDEPEMEPGPEPTRAATPPLRVASPRICRRGEEQWGSKELRVERKAGPFRERQEWATFTIFSDFRLRRKTNLGFCSWLENKEFGRASLQDLPSTYKGLMEKTYTWVEAREVATNGASSDRRDSLEMSKKSSWDNNRGQKNKDRFSLYLGPNHGLLPSLSKSPKEILAMEKATRSFEPPPKMFEKALNSGQLSHLVKGIKKERTKSSDTPRGESKKDKGIAPAEAPILIVSREAHIAKSLAQENTDYSGKEIIFPPVAKVNNTPVIIEDKTFGRKVGRVYMDSGSSCEIIYEHCFEKLNPTIKATKVDLKTRLVGFSGERSWSIGEVLLEITIGDAPSQGQKLLTSLLAIKFHTKKGIGTVLSTDDTDEGTKKARKILATNEERVLSYVNAEEKIISNADVFAWTHANMTGILRTIMVEGKPFNTKHKLNEYSHVKPIKQNKRGLGPDRNMAAYKETEELTKAGILQKVKHQTWVANPVIDRLENKVPLRVLFEVLPRRLQGLPSSPNGRRRRRQNKLLRRKRSLLLQEDAVWSQKYRGNIPKVSGQDIQSLNGKLAALSRFLSKGAKRSLAFFKVLKGCKDKKSIQWTTKADKALKKMKKLIQALPTLTAPRVGETLTMHLAASKESISAMLAAKRNEGWTSIYFVSRVLQGAELNYPALEKLVLALVHAARRLRRYFQAHTITVLTNTPIKQMLTGPEKKEVAKWEIELGEHDIVFLRRIEKETPTDFLV